MYDSEQSSASMPSFTLCPGGWERSVIKRHFPVLCPLGITPNQLICRRGRLRRSSGVPNPERFASIAESNAARPTRKLRPPEWTPRARWSVRPVGPAPVAGPSAALPPWRNSHLVIHTHTFAGTPPSPMRLTPLTRGAVAVSGRQSAIPTASSVHFGAEHLSDHRILSLGEGFGFVFGGHRRSSEGRGGGRLGSRGWAGER